MAVAMSSEAVWHNDGHEVRLSLNQHEVEVRPLRCPHETEEAPDCRHPDTPCVVEYFVNLYGLECNVGSSEAKPVLEIAWSLLGNQRDLFECQLWFIPLDDPLFASWLPSQPSS